VSGAEGAVSSGLRSAATREGGTVGARSGANRQTLPDAVVAIDVGGTTLKGALVASGGVALARLDAPTPAAEGGDAVARAIVELAGRLAAAGEGAAQPVRVVAAAAVTPGSVDAAAGVIRYAANLGWRDVPLAALLAAELGVPVGVDHDVRAAGLAETVYGQGSRAAADDCFFVALGTGIGSVLVAEGQARAGATGGAGELGHVPVYPDGDLCECEQRGCLEAYASAAAVGRRYARAKGLPSATARDVVAALGGDPVAARVWEEAVAALALSLATVTLVLDPGLVVLGGGLAEAGELLVAPLRERLTALLKWRPAPPVAVSTLGTDAGWLGASLCAWGAAGVAEAAREEAAAVVAELDGDAGRPVMGAAR